MDEETMRLLKANGLLPEKDSTQEPTDPETLKLLAAQGLGTTGVVASPKADARKAPTRAPSTVQPVVAATGSSSPGKNFIAIQCQSRDGEARSATSLHRCVFFSTFMR